MSTARYARSADAAHSPGTSHGGMPSARTARPAACTVIVLRTLAGRRRPFRTCAGVAARPSDRRSASSPIPSIAASLPVVWPVRLHHASTSSRDDPVRDRRAVLDRAQLALGVGPPVLAWAHPLDVVEALLELSCSAASRSIAHSLTSAPAVSTDSPTVLAAAATDKRVALDQRDERRGQPLCSAPRRLRVGCSGCLAHGSEAPQAWLGAAPPWLRVRRATRRRLTAVPPPTG